MIESIRMIGEAVLKGKRDWKRELLKLLTVEERGSRRRMGEQTPRIFKIIYDLDGRGILFGDPAYGIFPEAGEGSLEEYLFLRQDPSKRRALTIGLGRGKLSESYGKIFSRIEGELGELKEKGYWSPSLEEFAKMLSEIKAIHEEKGGAIDRKYEEERLGGRVFSFATVAALKGGELVELTRADGYVEYLIGTLLGYERLQEGRCHLCGFEGPVPNDPAFVPGTLLKIYAKDKRGFASNLLDYKGHSGRGKSLAVEGRLKSFAVCQECLKRLLAGCGYVEKRLRCAVPSTNVYVIPSYPFSLIKRAKLLHEDVADAIESVGRGAVNAFNAAVRLSEAGRRGHLRQRRQPAPVRLSEAVASARKEVEPIEKYLYALNILFSHPPSGPSSQFRFEGLVQDVPLYRLDELKHLEEEWTKRVGSWGARFSIDLETLSEAVLEGVRKGTGSRHERQLAVKWLISVYVAILNGQPFPEGSMVRMGMQTARRLFFAPGSSAEERVNDAVSAIAFFAHYILFLKSLRGAKEMGEVEFDVRLPRAAAEWLAHSGYAGWRKGLFLLGYTMSKIASAQAKGIVGGTKTIIDQVNFNGMSRAAVMRLANRVMKYISHYSLHEECDRIYAAAKRLLDEGSPEASSPLENAFCILSGYSAGVLSNHRVKGGEENHGEREQ